MDNNERIDDLIFLTKNLAELLAQENESLKRKQIAFVMENVERKISLARAYEVRVKGMALALAQNQDQDLTQNLAPILSEAGGQPTDATAPQAGGTDETLSTQAEVIDEAAVEHLRELGHRVEELVKENARLLKINIETGKRFMESLAEAVQQNTADAGVYGRQGRLGHDYAQRTQQSSSIALDQQL